MQVISSLQTCLTLNSDHCFIKAAELWRVTPSSRPCSHLLGIQLVACSNIVVHHPDLSQIKPECNLQLAYQLSMQASAGVKGLLSFRVQSMLAEMH